MKYRFVIVCLILLICIVSYELISALGNSDFGQLYTVQFFGLSFSCIAFVWELVDLHNKRNES